MIDTLEGGFMLRSLPSLSLLGMISMAITFGWVRYGFGLFLPHFEESFNLSTSSLGVISSLTYVSYLFAVLFVGVFTSKLGPRPMILIGLFTGSAGLLLASVTTSVFWFTVAMFVAGSSTGWCWSSFSDVVKNHIRTKLQERSLAVISTGATVGLLMVSTLYLVFIGEWRWIWGAFSLLGFLTTVWAYLTLPKKEPNTSEEEDKGKNLLHPTAMPLFLSSFLFGVTQSVYWTYAADFAQSALSAQLASGILWLLIGLGGLLGLLTGDYVKRLGFKKVLNLNIVVFTLSIGFLYISKSWWIISLSGLLFGTSFMVYSALFAIWSSKVFPSFPTKGFSTTIFMMTVGSIIGPALFGWLYQVVSFQVLFGILAIVALFSYIAQPHKQKVSSQTSY